METTVFMTRIPRNYKTKMEIKNTATKTPTSRNMIQTTEPNYRNNRRSNPTYLVCKKRWRTLSQPPSRSHFDKFVSSAATIARTEIIGFVSNFLRLKQKISFVVTTQHLWATLWLWVTLIGQVQSFELTTSTFRTKDTATASNTIYSQLLSTNGQVDIHDGLKNTKEADTFRPFVPTDSELMSRSIFTPSGQFRVFRPIDTDLQYGKPASHRNRHYDGINKMSKSFNTSLFQEPHTTPKVITNQQIFKQNINKHESRVYQNGLHYLSQPYETETHKAANTELAQNGTHHLDNPSKITGDETEQNKIRAQANLTADFKSLEDLVAEYVSNLFEKGHYEPVPGLLVEVQNNHSQVVVNKTRTVRQASATAAEARIDLPRTLQTGRLLFLTGLKKVLWPVFMGLQVLKSLLIAMFIPALIGSFTKLLGKGITTGSAPLFIRPMEAPQELDFRDNTFAFEDDNKFLGADGAVNGPYAYNQPDIAQVQNEYVFDPSSTNNQLSFTRLGMNERQHQLMQDSYMNALQSIGSASFKNAGSLSSGSSGLLAPMAKKPPPAANVNTFQQFQNVPDSSLLLSNYDPFYSPLLSRLDSVFAQLKINSDKEICREKLICLMYANPAKYAPYSNLVSAQLSRELNELRKPTSDNPDILRFFKYMRAAKDGQDGVDCEKTFDSCTEFKDFDNPAMVSTYHDINKLVQARKLTTN